MRLFWTGAGLPALGLDVMDVQVLAGLDRRDHLADVDAVFEHRVARLQRLERDLVTDRDVAFGPHFDHLVLLHDPAGERRASLDALDHDRAHRIAILVHHKMNHLCLLDLAVAFSSTDGFMLCPFKRRVNYIIYMNY